MKCGENQYTIRAALVRALSFSAVAALMLNPALSPVIAADSDSHPTPVASTASAKTRFLALGVGKSIVVEIESHV